MTFQRAGCAEEFDLAGPLVGPGTVMVIDRDGALRPSDTAYSRRVAGVVAGAEDLSSGLILDSRPDEKGRVAIALMGKTYCKADATEMPIEVGDLLTTSTTPGHAIKAGESQPAWGAVIGKALQPLAGGEV